eukprot:COSAG02_NODE_446_length_22141_cov_17.963842_2_plen_376_part_00
MPCEHPPGDESDQQLDDMVDFLGDWGADSDDGDLPELEQPDPEPEPRDALPVSGADASVRRKSVCIGLVAGPHSSFEAVEAAVRAVEWSERAIRWLGSKPPSKSCGFASKDMYTEFAKDLQDTLQALPGWCWLDGNLHSLKDSDPDYLTICCSVHSPTDESPPDLATKLVEHLQTRLPSSGTAAISGARVLLVSAATKIPLMPLARGLSSFVASKSQAGDAVAFAAQLLDDAGMCVMTDAVSDDDIQALAQLAVIRTAQIERALGSTDTNPSGKPIGSGDVTFAEICSRGVQRWDMLLHPPGQPLAVTGSNAGDQVMVDAGFAVLQRIATKGPWVATLEAALGLDASGYKWQASIICSRPVRTMKPAFGTTTSAH